MSKSVSSPINVFVRVYTDSWITRSQSLSSSFSVHYMLITFLLLIALGDFLVKEYKEFELIITIFTFRLTFRQYIYKQTKNPKLAFLMARSNKGQGFMHFCHERK